jgi:hypothetical protein
MNKTPFRKKVEATLEGLGKANQLKIAFETNGKMVGTSISEGGDVDVLYSPKGEVMYIDFKEGDSGKIDKIKESLKNEFNGVILSRSDKSFRIKLSSEEGSPKSESDTLNFRILKSGARTPTAMQERGSGFILSVALKTSSSYSNIDLGKNHIALEKNTYVYDGLKKIFSGYEDRVKDWTYTYYQQQKEFLKKYENFHWSEFQYGNNSFVKFFEEHVKNLYVTFGSSNPNKPAKKLQKYEQWNPSDIYAAYDMKVIKTELNEIINGKENMKGINLFRLNQYLIKLLKDKRLVGISLKKINKGDDAEMVLRNMDIKSYMDPKIESKQYKLSDITFDIDGIHNQRKKTVSTYIKFGDGYQVDLKGSSSKFNNIAFGTLIKAKSAAQGGNAPVNLVVRLMRRNGSGVTFTNDNSKYPRNDDEFYEPTASMYERSDYEKWFNVVKDHFTDKSVLYKNFETYIGGLYEDGDGAIAQSKLMQLHFYHDSFKENKLGVDYWTKILYLGMKVGRIFAPHEKIY